MAQLMHPQTPAYLASFKPRLVLPFWYRLTQVVLEKRPLNGCNSYNSRKHDQSVNGTACDKTGVHLDFRCDVIYGNQPLPVVKRIGATWRIRWIGLRGGDKCCRCRCRSNLLFFRHLLMTSHHSDLHSFIQSHIV